MFELFYIPTHVLGARIAKVPLLRVVSLHFTFHYGRSTCRIAGSVLPTRGLLAMDLEILSHGQMTRTTSEQAPSSPNFHTTLMGGRLSLDMFNVLKPPLHGGSSAVLGSNS
ncbi:hypothetical protein TNCV_3896631 [Trichonephila clavipes]|nr:hypothetical protein TNCV_3896631 [Trichonephila clavipes]